LKNKDINEWLLDEGIDPFKTVTTDNGEFYLSDILEKHLKEQLSLGAVVQAKPEVCDHEYREENRFWLQCTKCPHRTGNF
jgi:hypothetical protein